eukprot:TRINITY_DN38813_c0_g1_i1.p1 TRINITY_DN38813_c0_g1~~TRINITY_DN38813_c0_g1_i1.p1  ORF type:complete len:224 (-),score=39.85 TRINITY_DN38813_c0_g1_i1:92-763(-)
MKLHCTLWICSLLDIVGKLAFASAADVAPRSSPLTDDEALCFLQKGVEAHSRLKAARSSHAAQDIQQRAVTAMETDASFDGRHNEKSDDSQHEAFNMTTPSSMQSARPTGVGISSELKHEVAQFVKDNVMEALFDRGVTSLKHGTHATTDHGSDATQEVYDGTVALMSSALKVVDEVAEYGEHTVGRYPNFEAFALATLLMIIVIFGFACCWGDIEKITTRIG